MGDQLGKSTEVFTATSSNKASAEIKGEIGKFCERNYLVNFGGEFLVAD